MEFYKCLFRCSSTGITSADVGSIFQSEGAIDFTVHSNVDEYVWGIELLREREKLDEHLSRFHEKDGIYKNIPLLEYCVIDFRRIAEKTTIQENQMLRIAQDIKKYEKLWIVMYDNTFSNVIVYHHTLQNGLIIRSDQ